MKISLSGVWDDNVRILRANASLFLAIAGVFLFLPSVVLGYFAPVPGGAAVTPQLLADYYSRNIGWIALAGLIGFVGNLAILVLALDDSRPTVAAAIRRALALLWRYFLLSLITALLVGLAFIPALAWLGITMRPSPTAAGLFGTLVLMIPGIYLLVRLALGGPVIVGDRGTGAVAAIKRSWLLSRGNGWAIFGMFVVVVVIFWILSMAATAVFGSLFLLLDRVAGAGGLGAFLLLLLTSAIGAALNIVLMVLLAALYRRLAAPQPSSKGI